MPLSIHLRTERPSVKTGECPIVIRYHYDGKYFVISTGKKIMPRYWNAKAVYSWVKPDYGDTYQTYNRMLASMLKEQEEKVNEFYLKNKRDPNIEEMKLLNSGKKQGSSFFELFDEFIRTRDGKVTAGTLKNSKLVKKRFEAYQKHNRTPFDFSSINHGFYNHFTNYLIKEYKAQVNTIAFYFRILKAFLHWAELHHNIPLDKVVMSSMHVVKEQNFYVWLTLDEIERIYKLDFGNKVLLDRCRDAFVLQCMIGCRYSDLTKTFTENIVLEGGVYFLQIKTKKNEKLIKVPLAKKAVAILEKYKGISVSDWLPSMNLCNLNIKEVCKLAGMYEVVQEVRGSGDNRKENRFQKWQRIGTHTARRSAINILKGAGIPDHVIASITGQSISTIQGYKHADTSDVLKAITVFDRPRGEDSPEPKQRD